MYFIFNGMKKILFTILFIFFVFMSQAQQRQIKGPGLHDSLLLKDYTPQSLFKQAESNPPEKAKYLAIDMHMHAPRNATDAIAHEMLENMEKAGIQKTILFCGIGETFDKNVAVFGKYPDKFELWCWLDLSDSTASTIAELERCVQLGAKGIGELHDKGGGLPENPGMHYDDPRFDPILDKIEELNLPINAHIAEPIWMYESMDKNNDLLFEAYYWRLDNKTAWLSHSEVVASFERALQKHPKITFIAAHFLNMTYDLNQLGRFFEKYPNLYADVSQREAYVAAIPRFTKKFMEKYADRLLFGTDQGYSLPMYRNSFRVWQTNDEHFYAWDVANTRWPMSGIDLSDDALKKLYRKNALKILKNR